MHYAIQHTTTYHYGAPIVENVMEVRLQPRSDELQQCVSFHLYLRPAARVHPFLDHLNNWVHFYDIAAAHKQLTITANSVVNVLPQPPLPDALPMETWDEIDALANTSAQWEWMQPSFFTPAPPALYELVAECGIDRSVDPLTMLRRVNAYLHSTFSYNTESTRVDSPIDEALASRSGVCQDFTHILLAITRHVLRIPSRYISGYMFHREDDRSEEDATHAWAEILLPGLGWVGFDPTNNLVAGERHIRVAIGRDYDDVPPTTGIFHGASESKLGVSVTVKKSTAPLPVASADPAPRWRYEAPPAEDRELREQEQQQQQ